MKWNQKLKNKFFEPFQVLYSIKKQVYKLELLTRLKILQGIFCTIVRARDYKKKADK